MAPREATNPFPDQYLTVEYDATVGPIGIPQGPGGAGDTGGGAQQDVMGDAGGAGQVDVDLDFDDTDPPISPVDNVDNVANQGDDDSMEEETDNTPAAQPQEDDASSAPSQPPQEVQLPTPANTNTTTHNAGHGQTNHQGLTARRRHRLHQNNTPNNHHHPNHRNNHQRPAGQRFNRLDRPLQSIGSDSHMDVDPLAIDMTDPEEEEAWNIASAMLVDSAIASASNANCTVTAANAVNHGDRPQTPVNSRNTSVSERGTTDSVRRRHDEINNNSGGNNLISPSRRRSTGGLSTPRGMRNHTSSSTSGGPFAVSPSPVSSPSLPPVTRPGANHIRQMYRHRTRSLSSVLDQDPSIDSASESGEDDNNNITPEEDTMEGVPDLDTTQDTTTSANTSYSTAPYSPESSILDSDINSNNNNNTFSYTTPDGEEILPASSSATTVTRSTANMTLSPVRTNRPSQSVAVVTDEDTESTSSSSMGNTESSTNSPIQAPIGTTSTTAISGSTTTQLNSGLPSHPFLPSPPSPHRLRSISNSTAASFVSINSGRSIHWTPAFDSASAHNDDNSITESYVHSGGSDTHTTTSSATNASPTHNSPIGNINSNGANQINLAFGPNTSVADLKYFAERGCIVPLLRALKTARLKTLGTRMLADYAKMPHRRVAVASNRRILEFCCRTMLEIPSGDNMGTEWPAREYAVETIRSLTATEDSDVYLMGCTGLLKALAVVARGGPFAVSPDVVGSDVERPHSDSSGAPSSPSTHRVMSSSSTGSGSFHSSSGFNYKITVNNGLVSGKARLHACIAIMNLSCGKANKIEIASVSEILEAMRDVMMAPSDHFSPATSSPPLPNGSNCTTTPNSVAEEAHLKAATCIKNLSNADLNDAALLGSKGLIEALGYIAAKSCTDEKGATNCTTNACLALMNLSISKANKHKVFKTKGVMDALMAVITRTSPAPAVSGRRHSCNKEARVKACSALSNLAIGYENKIPMFAYPGFVDSILQVIDTDIGEARTKACSILWSFAAEMKNQVPVVRRGDILPTLVRVAAEDNSTEARFKCVAALTLLAESLDNAIPLLESGALHPIMDILHDAGADPTQWKGQTASWCVGFLMNIAQSDGAVPFLREAGVVELLAPLLTLDHYQSLKAAMAVTFVCRYDEDDETYDLLRKTENVIPKIISLLHNTLSGRGGNGYKYGVFTLRSSVGCISSLASGPDFMKERIATGPVFDSLLRVVTDFCVNGGTKGAIVGGGRDDALSATLAVRALQNLTKYYIPIASSSALPFGSAMDRKLMTALDAFESCKHPDIKDETCQLAADANERIQQSQGLASTTKDSQDSGSVDGNSARGVRSNIIENSIVASLVQGCCIGPSLHTGDDDGFFLSLSSRNSSSQQSNPVARGADAVDCVSGDESIASASSRSLEGQAVRTFLLTDSKTGRRFAVPNEPSGGRAFNDGSLWCYRRGRFCRPGEVPDPNFRWTEELENIYSAALAAQRMQRSTSASQQSVSSHSNTGGNP